METDYRLYILYEMVQAMGSHDHVESLLRDVLQKLLYHSKYPLGAVFLRQGSSSPSLSSSGDASRMGEEGVNRCRLAMVVGDRNLKKQIGSEFHFAGLPCSLMPATFSVDELPGPFPLNREHYKSFLVLPIPDQGVILLFSRSEGGERRDFLEWVKPVMGNLSRAIHFCRLNEEHIREVESDRDAARRRALRFRRAIDTTPDFILLADPRTLEIVDFNRSVDTGLGYGEADIYSLTLDRLIPMEREMLRERLERTLEEGASGAAFDAHLVKKDGSSIFVSIHTSLLAEEESSPVVILTIRDISLRKKMEERLGWQAAHDSLTGLFNRRRFEAALDDSLRAYREQGTPHVLLYMDLDQFKIINDISGHMAGDNLLREISSRIQRVLPDSSLFARLGGDEFGLILPEQSLPNSMAIAQRIHHVVDGITFYWEEKSYRVGVSIGLVPFRKDHISANRLMSIADMACYAAKEGGRNRTHVYDGEDPDFQRHKTEIEWAAELKKAFQEDRFRLHSQLILPLKNSPAHPLHAEVLLRLETWEGLILPEQFLPAARKYNLMGEIDRFVIQRVISGLAAQNRDDVPIYFINLSNDSVNDSSISQYIQDCLREYRLDPSRIGFEVTESATIANLGNTIEFISELKYLGIQFALDDFGTGLSSFSYLKKLPLDLIKIDGSFIENIASDLVDRRMVESIHHIGSMLNLRTTAEYVKDEEILHHVRALGIDYAQGFAVGHPQPLLFQG